jgi:hypothetical protein
MKETLKSLRPRRRSEEWSGCGTGDFSELVPGRTAPGITLTRHPDRTYAHWPTIRASIASLTTMMTSHRYLRSGHARRNSAPVAIEDAPGAGRDQDERRSRDVVSVSTDLHGGRSLERYLVALLDLVRSRAQPSLWLHRGSVSGYSAGPHCASSAHGSSSSSRLISFGGRRRASFACRVFRDMNRGLAEDAAPPEEANHVQRSTCARSCRRRPLPMYGQATGPAS